MFDFSLIPYWVYYILSGIALLIIWHYMGDDAKISVKHFFKKYGVWILIILIYFHGKYHWGNWINEDFFINKANTFLIVMSLLWFGLNGFLGKQRYLSTHAICDNRSGSCAKYQPVGDYVILNIGSCDAHLFPWDYGHETWVIPFRHFNKINNRPYDSCVQIDIKTNVKKADLTEIPTLCSDYIETTTGFNKEEIYYGEFSLDELKSGYRVDLDGKKISLEDYEIKLRDSNRMINESRAMVKGKTKSILGYISHTSTIMRKAKGGDKKRESYDEGGD